jgi:purine-binding chemotaxis protein CheW
MNSSVPKRNRSEKIELSVFQVGETTCALEISDVQEINKNLDITAVSNANMDIRGILNMRGAIITVLDMREKFGYEAVEANENMRIIVIKYQGESIGLLVDKIVDVVFAAAVDMEAPPSNIDGIAGTYFSNIYKMDNDLVAILNIEELLKNDHILK